MINKSIDRNTCGKKDSQIDRDTERFNLGRNDGVWITVRGGWGGGGKSVKGPRDIL